MSLPFWTTTVRVWGRRQDSHYDPYAEGYDVLPDAETNPSVVATGVKAQISMLNIRSRGEREGGQETDLLGLRMEMVDADGNSFTLSHFDQIEDLQDNTFYEIRWVTESLPRQFGLEHYRGEVIKVSGLRGGQETTP